MKKRMKLFLEQIAHVAAKNPVQISDEEYARFRANMRKRALKAQEVLA